MQVGAKGRRVLSANLTDNPTSGCLGSLSADRGNGGRQDETWQACDEGVSRDRQGLHHHEGNEDIAGTDRVGDPPSFRSHSQTDQPRDRETESGLTDRQSESTREEESRSREIQTVTDAVDKCRRCQHAPLPRVRGHQVEGARFESP
jgi:hypothetical protein